MALAQRKDITALASDSGVENIDLGERGSLIAVAIESSSTPVIVAAEAGVKGASVRLPGMTGYVRGGDLGTTNLTALSWTGEIELVRDAFLVITWQNDNAANVTLIVEWIET